jgi:hypothetical protein
LLTLKEKPRLREYDSRALRRIFVPRRDEAQGEWRKLHYEELNDLRSSPTTVRVTKSRMMVWAGHVARVGVRRGIYIVLVGKPVGNRPLGRPRHRWKDNNEMDLQEWNVGVWTGSSWLGIETGGIHL